MSEETWSLIPGAEVLIAPKLKLSIVERIEEQVQAMPGKLLKLKVATRKLARPLPEGFAIDPADPVHRAFQERVVEVVEGVYLGTGGFFVAANGATPLGFFGGGGLIGPAPGGSRLEAQDLYAWVEAALEREVFTLAEITRFCEDPRALKALREGACQHVLDQIAKVPTCIPALAAPGVTIGGDPTTNAEYVKLHLQRLDAPSLLKLVKKVREVTA